MLQMMRARIQGWVAGIILVVVAVVFGLWGIGYYMSGHHGASDVVIKVNGEPIYADSLKQLANQMTQSILAQRPGQPISKQQRQAIVQQARHELIQRTALRQQAQTLGFVVSDAMLADMLIQIPAFQVEGHFSKARFEQFLVRSKTTEAGFLALIRANLLTRQWFNLISLSAVPMPEAVARAYALQYQSRHVGYVRIPLSYFSKQVVLAPKELTAYYQAHLKDFQMPESVRIAYVHLSPEDLIGQVASPSEDDLQQFYASHIKQYETPVQWEFDRLHTPMPSAMSADQHKALTQQWEKIAKELTAGRSMQSYQSVGKTYTARQRVSAKDIAPGLLKSISTLRPGGYSEPFVQAGQLQIIRLLSKVPAKQLTFKAARSQVKKDWIRSEVGHLFDQQVEQLANLSYMHPDELASTAKVLGVGLKTTPFFSRGKATVDFIRANPALVQTAFSDEVLLAGHNSTVIHLRDNSVVVLRVLKRQLAKPKPFSAVKTEIVSALRDKKQRARSGLFVYQLSEGLNKQQAPNALMAQHGLRWHDEMNFRYNQKTLPAELISAVFKTVPAQVSGESGIDTVMLADGTAFLFKVFSAKAPEPSGLDEKKKAGLTQALTELNERALAALSVKAVVDSAQVKSVASR